ncbi:hypothetical protein GWK47_040854 [Chionoecetes opilio]|uniref:Uncharacterized protein n=1 Tax=Chionoecetes opilio TaxID=41210 RepID=A0A8J4YCX9_CHIOP|nr:hypothetical protein GWK47_040854 [Chionoecetes opilio]
MNVSELSGQQQQQQQHGERRTRCIQEDTLSLDSSGPTHVPCSDPDFIRNTKSGVRGTQSYPIAATRNSICGGEYLDGRMSGFLTLKALKSGKDGATHKKVSPLLPRRSQLALPKVKVKRSSSMTRLTEALNQVHNVCLIPAQPRTLVKHGGPHAASLSLTPQSTRHGSPR